MRKSARTFLAIAAAAAVLSLFIRCDGERNSGTASGSGASTQMPAQSRWSELETVLKARDDTETLAALAPVPRDIAGPDGTTLIHAAAQFNRVNALRWLLDHGMGVNELDGQSRTPLHAAASADAPDALLVLVEHGADLGAKDRRGMLPIHHAADNDSPRALVVLLEHGADLNAAGGFFGSTALALASRKSNIRCMELLIQHGADPCRPEGSAPRLAPVVYAAGSPRGIGALRWYQDAKVDLHGFVLDGRTLLHDAAFTGALESVALLLDAGLDPDSRDKDGDSARDYFLLRGDGAAWASVEALRRPR
ncbi:MAG: ankyrin repeat domain-containing protein [Phycisphaerales bacterium]